MQENIIVWDFDGVLNANVVGGRFVWADKLKQDWGIDRDAFVAYLFHRDRIGQIMRGDIDLREELQRWFADAGHDADTDAFLAYWFSKDAMPDAEVTCHLERSDATHVIGTNNEARRATFIERDMGFGDLVSRIFASGRMGHAKPDTAYFRYVETWSGAAAQNHVLIDDTEANVKAARGLGWQGFHFIDETRGGLPAFLDQLG